MDPYSVLGATRQATAAEITAKYRALLRALHPDTRQEPADPDRLAAVLAAYALLRDPHRRAAYDAAHPEPAARRHVYVRTHEPDIRAGPVRRHQW